MNREREEERVRHLYSVYVWDDSKQIWNEVIPEDPKGIVFDKIINPEKDARTYFNLVNPFANRNDKVGMVMTLFSFGYSPSEVIGILEGELKPFVKCRWEDYIKEKSIPEVEKLYKEWKHKEQCKPALNHHNTTNFSGLPSHSSNSQGDAFRDQTETEDLITKVQWRKPDVKPTSDSIKLYFINNTATNAVQFFNTSEEKWGYKPMKHSEKNILRHLDTGINPTIEHPFTYGAYEKNEDDKGKWLLFDFDEKDDRTGSNLRDAKKIIGYFVVNGITPMLENASEGIESYHVWVFCEPTDIRTLQAIGKGALEATGVKCEVFPKGKAGSKLGNLVRIPFGLNRKRNKKSKILAI